MKCVWPSEYLNYLAQEMALAEERLEREYPRAKAAERRSVIDAVLRRNLGEAIRSACFYAWCLGPGSAPGVVCTGYTRL